MIRFVQQFRKIPFLLIIIFPLAWVFFLSVRYFIPLLQLNDKNLFVLCFFVAGIIVALFVERYTKERDEKKHLRGTRLVPPEQFVTEINGDGIAVPNNAGSDSPDFLQIAKSDECQHMLLIGDTGTGKSGCIHYLLEQIRHRPGDCAIIFDPKLEYWKFHGRPENGDTLLYPFQENAHYWDLTDEIRRPETATLIAESLLPCKPGEEENFFISKARFVVSALLEKAARNKLTVAEILSWLSDDKGAIIHKVLKGHPSLLAIPLDSKGRINEQASGILGTISEIARQLLRLPGAPDETRKSFSFASWCENRPGWVFIGADGVADQNILRPLFSIWFNIAFQQLLGSNDREYNPATWIFIDELASLQSLSFLEQAISQARGYNVRIVLGIQNISQVENFYKRLSKTILAGPKTKLFLRCGEAETARWCADTAGESEFSQYVMSDHNQLDMGAGRSVSYRFEEKDRYLVLPSEFAALEDRSGYLLYRGLVVPISYDYPNLTARNSKVKKSDPWPVTDEPVLSMNRSDKLLSSA